MLKNNGKLWDAIAEYAWTHHEFMSCKKVVGGKGSEYFKAFEKAQADLISIIGKRNDEDENHGGNYDPADYA